MSCSNCGNGISLPIADTAFNGSNGLNAPTVTNIALNNDNTFTFTYSDGTSFTTGNSINIDTSQKSYIFYHDSVSADDKTFSIPSETLDTDGDKLIFTFTGRMNVNIGADNLIMNINGQNFDVWSDPNNTAFQAVDVILKGELIRIDNTTIRLIYTFATWNSDFLDSYESAYEYTYENDFTNVTLLTSNTTVYIGQTDGIFDLMSVQLVKND